jgi:hypothetical protein
MTQKGNRSGDAAVIFDAFALAAVDYTHDAAPSVSTITLRSDWVEREHITLSELDHRLVGPAPRHQHNSGRFVKRRRRIDPRSGLHQHLVNIFDGFDGVGLAEDDIDTVRLISFAFRGWLRRWPALTARIGATA